MESRNSPGHDQAVPLWPLTVGSPLARAGRRIAGPLSLVIETLLVAPTGAVPFHRPLTKRLRDLHRGHTTTFEAIIIGSSPWCPKYPDPNRIGVTSHSAISTLGRHREIPLTELAVVALHQPRERPRSDHLPRSFWVVDLDGSGGPGSLAARLEDLALLAAVAGWPPPPELTRLAR